MSEAFDRAKLAHFTGSEVVFRHGLVRDIRFTEGTKYVADTAGAYWLLDEIALANRFNRAVRAEEFQVWTLTVAGSRGELVCGDGNGGIVSRKRIRFTDFPEPGIEMWVEQGVILLPSEH